MHSCFPLTVSTFEPIPTYLFIFYLFLINFPVPFTTTFDPKHFQLNISPLPFAPHSPTPSPQNRIPFFILSYLSCVLCILCVCPACVSPPYHHTHHFFLLYWILFYFLLSQAQQYPILKEPAYYHRLLFTNHQIQILQNQSNTRALPIQHTPTHT